MHFRSLCESAIPLIVFGTLCIKYYRRLDQYESYEFTTAGDRSSKPWIVVVCGFLALPVQASIVAFLAVSDSYEDHFIYAMVVTAFLINLLSAFCLVIPEIVWKKTQVVKKVSTQTVLAGFRLLPWVFFVSLAFWATLWALALNGLMKPYPPNG